jgi:hypothetical protein
METPLPIKQATNVVTVYICVNYDVRPDIQKSEVHWPALASP